MATYSGAYISDSGLVFALDASNQKYLTNTQIISTSNITYSSSSGGGSIVFNGSSSSISIPNVLNQANLSQVWTVSAWINITDKVSQTLLGGLNADVAVCYSQGNNSLLYLNGGANDYYTYGGDLGGIGWTLATFRFRNSDGARTIYRNTANISTGGPNNTSTPSGQASTFTIGSGGVGYMAGNLAQMLIYNRYITDAELTSIYDNTRARFGL
jgi:hypothetical protein